MPVWFEKSISKEEHEKFIPYSKIVPCCVKKWENHDIILEMFEHQWYFTEHDERNDKYEVKCRKTSCITLYANEPRIPREAMAEAFTGMAKYNKVTDRDEVDEAEKRVAVTNWRGGGCSMSWTVDNINPEYVGYAGLIDFVRKVNHLLEWYIPEEFEDEDEDEDE